jgi:hypothetical protein
VRILKKIISLGLILGMVAFLAWALPAFAKNEGRPKGLEDRGPLTKITYIHYKKGYVKPPKPPKPDRGKEVACYGFLGREVYWKNLSQKLVINPWNPDGLSKNFVTTTFSTSAQTWDKETLGTLYDGYSVEYDANLDDDPDGKNELLFGNYPEDNVIAVAYVWGYFGGPPQLREIVEFNILFDTDFTWGNADNNNTSVMDLENIATHEMGHGWGLDDMYQDACSSVTMYGYSDYGETIKRDLEPQDIKGIQELYGVSSE